MIKDGVKLTNTKAKLSIPFLWYYSTGYRTTFYWVPAVMTVPKIQGSCFIYDSFCYYLKFKNILDQSKIWKFSFSVFGFFRRRGIRYPVFGIFCKNFKVQLASARYDTVGVETCECMIQFQNRAVLRRFHTTSSEITQDKLWKEISSDGIIALSDAASRRIL